MFKNKQDYSNKHILKQQRHMQKWRYNDARFAIVVSNCIYLKTYAHVSLSYVIISSMKMFWWD